MTIFDFCQKYSVSTDIARVVKRDRQQVRSRDFDIYYGLNTPSPELSAMNEMIAQNPNWKPVYWQEQGPCSNWGYYLTRDETDEEYEVRIQYEIEQAPIKLNDKKMILESAKEKYPNCFK